MNTSWEAPSATVPVDRLEVIGVGLIAEKLRMRDAWIRVKASDGQKAVSDDPKLYDNTMDGKRIVFTQREHAALEWALRAVVEGWTIPNIRISPHISDLAAAEWLQQNDWVDGLLRFAGLHWHRTKKYDHVFNDVPDEALERAFQVFDTHPDCPAVLLYVSHRGNQDMGPRKPTDPTEAIAVLVLARRERVEWLRNFAPYTRGHANGYPEFTEWRRTPPKPFTPSACIPKPWTQEQFAQLDKLPTIAIVHRPVTVRYRNADGAPMAEPERHAAFAAGWAKALEALPKGADGKLHPRAVPARVLFDYGDAAGARAIVPVTVNLLHSSDPAALRLDVLDPKFGFNTFNILGETRMASPLLQWTLGSIATWTEKDVSVTLTLRNPDQATITVITPDNQPANLGRAHPGGSPIDFPLRPN